jgi:hypothetical protein
MPHEKPSNWDELQKTESWPEPIDEPVFNDEGSDIVGPGKEVEKSICPGCGAEVELGTMQCPTCMSDVGGEGGGGFFDYTSYYFVNEQGQKVPLAWKKDLKIGSQFERPDTGTTVRLIGYKESRLVAEDVLINDLVTAADKKYRCTTCDSSFSEGQKKFHSGHDYSAKGKEDKEEEEKKEEPEEKEVKTEEKEATLQFTAADVSDQIPPMSWTNDESKGDKPAGAGPALPQQQNLERENQAKPDVLYDSNQDSGPQFQTTIDPKEKSVKVKFIDSPQSDALTQAINAPQTPIGQPPAQTPPAAPPAQPAGQGAPQQGFQDQQVPVNF